MFPKFMTAPKQNGCSIVIAGLPCHCRLPCHCGPRPAIQRCAWHWIPDVETPDLIRVRDDKVSLSLRATTRNPVVAWHWIPDVETPDLIRGRDDKLDVRDDKLDVRDGSVFLCAHHD